MSVIDYGERTVGIVGVPVSAPRDFYEAAEKARQYARDGMRKNDVLALIDLLEMHHKSDMSAIRRKNDTGK